MEPFAENCISAIVSQFVNLFACLQRTKSAKGLGTEHCKQGKTHKKWCCQH